MADAIKLRGAVSLGRALPLGASFGSRIPLLGGCAFFAHPIAPMRCFGGEGSLREELSVTGAEEMCLLSAGTLAGSRTRHGGAGNLNPAQGPF